MSRRTRVPVPLLGAVASTTGAIVAALALHGVAACSTGEPASPGSDEVEAGEDATVDAGEDACPVQRIGCPASPPSWSGEVEAIVRDACGDCHQDGGIEEPVWNFSTLTLIQNSHGEMFEQIVSCNMPPPDAAPLTSTNELALLEWLKCGAPDN